MLGLFIVTNWGWFQRTRATKQAATKHAHSKYDRISAWAFTAILEHVGGSNLRLISNLEEAENSTPYPNREGFLGMVLLLRVPLGVSIWR
jgi:hypothetical protein